MTYITCKDQLQLARGGGSARGFRHSILTRFFSSRKFSLKNIPCIFARTKLNENNFTSTRGGHYLRKSHCLLEMACEKEMASCVRGYHIYKDIWAATIIFA